MRLFGAGKTDHPMSDLKDARKILEAIPAGDPFKALEDLNHWLESVRTWEGPPGEPLRLRGDAEYGEAFRALLAEAVRARLRSTTRRSLSARRRGSGGRRRST